MSRVKTFLIYALLIILFFIFSELIINIGLNSSYKNMVSKSTTEKVVIQQAQATLVNGRIKGNIKNIGPQDLNGKYVKIDIYSERDVFLGSKYYEIKDLDRNKEQYFELYFKAQYAKYYDVQIVDEKEEKKLELDFIPEDLKKPEIILTTALALIMFW